MKNNYLISTIAGAGHACELAKALRKYIPLRSIYLEKDGYGLDFIDPTAYITQKDFPKFGNILIIVTAYVYRHLENLFGKSYFKNFEQVIQIVPDGVFWDDPARYNRAWKDFKVFCTPCKIQYRGEEQTKEYYQPFDLKWVMRTKYKYVTVSHSPFSDIKETEKGTYYLQNLIKDLNVKYTQITGIPWVKAMQLKAKSHIFVDQIPFTNGVRPYPADWRGGIGKSGLEAMNLRCCTMSWGQFEGIEIPAPPVVWITQENFHSKFYEIIANNRIRKEWTEKQFEWASKYTNPDFCARRILT